MTPYAISRTLSVMTSSGMYDYAGEWIYRVGIPAKSGVGGGILAALPARLGLGSYSPKLDKHGNSVRGIKVCEALSSHYDLHMLNRSDDARTSIIADYSIGKNPSRRSRRPHERDILAAHHEEVRVIELVGTLSFSNVDYVSRQLAGKAAPAIRHLRSAPRHLADARRRAAGRGRVQRARRAKRHRDPGRREARLAGMEHHAGMDRQPDEYARFLPARHRDRMGRRPADLPLWRRDRLPRDHGARRTAAARGPLGGRTDRPRFDRDGPSLRGGRENRLSRRTRDLAVLPAQRRGSRHPARWRQARDTDRRHGLWRDGADRASTIR